MCNRPRLPRGTRQKGATRSIPAYISPDKRSILTNDADGRTILPHIRRGIVIKTNLANRTPTSFKYTQLPGVCREVYQTHLPTPWRSWGSWQARSCPPLRRSGGSARGCRSRSQVAAPEVRSGTKRKSEDRYKSITTVNCRKPVLSQSLGTCLIKSAAKVEEERTCAAGEQSQRLRKGAAGSSTPACGRVRLNAGQMMEDRGTLNRSRKCRVLHVAGQRFHVSAGAGWSCDIS